MNTAMSTSQKVFNKIARHLLKQKSKCMDDGDYQLRNSEGMACAIGCLIPKSKYKKDMENNPIFSVQCALEIPKETYGLLADAMNIHDSSYPYRWKDKLQAMAKKHELDFPKELV